MLCVRSSVNHCSAESTAAIAVGFAAGITSTIVTSWVPVSSLGRAVVFVGSCVSGAVLAHWASRASTAKLATGKCALAGAVQANVSGTALLGLAIELDAALHLTPRPGPPPSLLALAAVMLFVGTVFGLFFGLAYSPVPALVAGQRKRPSLADGDRTLFASAVFIALVAAIHAVFVTHWAAWAPLVALGSVLASTAALRTLRRAHFLARVRAGREPRYRIEPTEGHAVLYRIAEEDEDREHAYRENASPAAEPEAVAYL